MADTATKHPAPKRTTPPSVAPIKRRGFRIDEWCERTRTSRATTWRRIKDGSLEVTYLGRIPFITGGPAGLFDESA
jgi:hypothetical protein